MNSFSVIADKRVPRYFYPFVVNPIMFNPNLNTTSGGQTCTNHYNAHCKLPTKHWTSNGRADQVYIKSVEPRPILDVSMTC
ncbi:hypothetical protein ILYODFUR_036673 [Ilyodon furcidens]|uniref:Uncharacterized protein n=1 Tax=Ilyodon furcidens TaxID=33524 RepID=A0ABV0VN28_9TELE